MKSEISMSILDNLLLLTGTITVLNSTGNGFLKSSSFLVTVYDFYETTVIHKVLSQKSNQNFVVYLLHTDYTTLKCYVAKITLFSF